MHSLLVKGTHPHSLPRKIFVSEPNNGVMKKCCLLMAIVTFHDLCPGMTDKLLAKLLDPGWREGSVGYGCKLTLLLELSICNGLKNNKVVVAVKPFHSFIYLQGLKGSRLVGGE